MTDTRWLDELVELTAKALPAPYWWDCDAAIRVRLPALLALAREARAWRAMYDGVEVENGISSSRAYIKQQQKYNGLLDRCDAARAASDAALAAMKGRSGT